jgi:hypothetical protein
MTIPDPTHPEQPRREFKNYSGNFLIIRLKARTWLLVTSTCLVRYNTTLVANVSLMTKRLKRRCEAAETTVEIFLYCRFRHTGKAMGHVYQCRWSICREINVFSKFECHMCYVLYPFVTCLLNLSRTTCILKLFIFEIHVTIE